jgi:replicative DNA helicase
MSMLSAVTASDPRVAPHNLEAEQSTLGGMLLSQEAVAEVVEEIAGVDFYAGKHELIYNAILYLHSLASYVPTAANAGYYAKIVGDKAILRRLIDAGTRIAQSGYDSQGEVEDLVNQAQAEVYKVSSQSSKEDYVGLSDSLEAAIHDIELAQNRGGEMTGTPTGFTDLDAYTHGLHAGQLIIVAARPAVGKSTFALDIARNASVRHNQATIFFSLEMGRSEIAMRMLSAESSIYLQSMRKGTISEGDWTRLAAVRGRINDAPLYIDDSPNMSLVEIRAKCRRLAQQVDLKLVVIDYIQLMSSGKKVESRQQEVSEFSRALKLLAKELGLPVVALSQLNRQAEQSKDKRPELSHLRESGSLEQDADVVVLLHREGIYERDHPRAGEADLILAKQRNGPTGTVTVAFHGQYSRFVNMPS